MRRTLLIGTLAAAALAGCAPHLDLSVNPDPVVLGRLDTHAIVQATAVGAGLGPLHIASLDLKLWGGAQYLGHDIEIFQQSIPVDRTVFVVPFMRVTRPYDVPISAWEVLVGNARYATVELRDGAGKVIGAARVGFEVDPRAAHLFK